MAAGPEKKVLLICPHFPPEFIAGATYTKTLTDNLRSKGWTVYATPSQPAFPFGTQFKRAPWRESGERLEVRRVPSFPPRRKDPPTWHRMLHFLAYMIFASILGVFLVLRHRIRVVIVSSPPEPVLAAGSFVAALTRRPLVIAARDTWLENAVTLGFAKENAGWVRLFRWMRARAFRRASAVFTTSNEVLRVLSKTCPIPSRTYLITNGFDPSRIPRLEKRDLRELVYLGNLGHAYAFDPLLEAMQRLPPTYRLRFVGRGDQEDALRAKIHALGLAGRVSMESTDSKDQIFAMLASAGLGLSPLKEDPRLGGVLPIKLIEYMGCGLPFVASGAGETARIATESQGGRLVSLEPQAWVDAILFLSTNEEQYEVASARGRSYAKAFETPTIAELTDRALMDLIERRSA